MESPYDGIFLRVTSLGNFKTWKVNMHIINQSKALGNDVETFPSNDNKNVYQHCKRVQRSRGYGLDLVVRV